MNSKVILGSFDAEKFWRNDRFAELPCFIDKNANNIILSMDELLFPICSKNDILLTRFKLNSTQKNYLEQIGFKFTNNEINLQDAEDQSEKCIFELLYNKHNNKYFSSLLNGTYQIDSYAVLPKTESACKKYNIKYNSPKSEDIKKVNSKIYSHELHDRIGITKYGTVIRNSKELETAGKKYKENAFLIKDAFGVSGKGNILITSKRMLDRIVKHILFQENKGLETCLLLEPLLDKHKDFSTQLIIDKNGSYEIISTQNIYNNGFSYLGSISSDYNFKSYLDSKGYFEIIDKTAVELFKDGYYGNVCVDSMILKNDEIVPIVEVNARKSMGLINYYIDKYLDAFLTKGYFMFFNVGFKGSKSIDEILNKFEDEKILFKPEKKEGIIPLSYNTLFINRDMDDSDNPEKIYKGRFYISAAGENQEKRLSLVDKARDVLTTLNFKIYN